MIIEEIKEMPKSGCEGEGEVVWILHQASE